MNKFSLIVCLLASSFASARQDIGQIVIGQIGNFQCSRLDRTTKISVFGTIDYGTNTQTGIFNFDAKYSCEDIQKFMREGSLAFTYDDKIGSLLSIAPYSGKIPCGTWNGWVNSNCTK